MKLKDYYTLSIDRNGSAHIVSRDEVLENIRDSLSYIEYQLDFIINQLIQNHDVNQFNIRDEDIDF